MKIPVHPKLKGEWAEVHFLARASEHGLSVAKPYGDCRPYDFIIENNGHMFRVQVKATSCRRGYGYTCQVRASREPRYDALDFLAAYVIPEDVWYIIPAAQVAGKKVIHLQPCYLHSRYAPFLEAWHLLVDDSPGEVRRRRKEKKRARL